MFLQKLTRTGFQLSICISLSLLLASNTYAIQYCKSGDFNGDEQVDSRDLRMLEERVRIGHFDRRFDVNMDMRLDWDDVLSWIRCSKGTCVGDINLDGIFNSTDIRILFSESIYQNQNTIATWMTGDWNGDGKFDSSDLLLAFEEGNYEGD